MGSFTLNATAVSRAVKTITLIDSAEIATMLGVTRHHALTCIMKRPDFPAPAVNISRKLRRWNMEDVQRWMFGKKKN